MSISGLFEFLFFYFIFYMCHSTVGSRVKMIQFGHSFNSVPIFVKMKQYCSSLN